MKKTVLEQYVIINKWFCSVIGSYRNFWLICDLFKLVKMNMQASLGIEVLCFEFIPCDKSSGTQESYHWLFGTDLSLGLWELLFTYFRMLNIGVLAILTPLLH